MRQEKRMANPGKNNVFVGSRQGGPKEHMMTKRESIKHHNPEYFKRQSDRKNHDNTRAMPKKDNMRFGNDPGRGVGQVGKDQAPFQMKQFSKGLTY